MTTIQEHAQGILNLLGHNRSDLHDTPKRYEDVLMYCTKGYQHTVHDIAQSARFPIQESDAVCVRNIEVYSLCEHHLLPFFGRCHIVYLPNQYILGLSAIGKIVELFARRLQVQERLTQEIATGLLEASGAQGVHVMIEAQHLCLSMCGLQKQHAHMMTCATRGVDLSKTFSVRGCL